MVDVPWVLNELRDAARLMEVDFAGDSTLPAAVGCA